MSTNAILTITQNGSPILTLHCQYDGYPSGFGKDLANFLTGFTIMNSLGAIQGKTANGAGCLAAQLVYHFKVGPGNIYLLPPTDPDGYEWSYSLDIPFGYQGPIERLRLSIRTYDKDVFLGTTPEFLDYLKDEQA
jgi:hypothetical protein